MVYTWTQTWITFRTTPTILGINGCGFLCGVFCCIGDRVHTYSTVSVHWPTLNVTRALSSRWVYFSDALLGGWRKKSILFIARYIIETSKRSVRYPIQHVKDVHPSSRCFFSFSFPGYTTCKRRVSFFPLFLFLFPFLFPAILYRHVCLFRGWRRRWTLSWRRANSSLSITTSSR